MLDLMTFKDELSLIIDTMAKSVVTEIYTAAQKVSLNKQNPEAEKRLAALVDCLCVEAVEKILKMVELAVVKNQESPGPVLKEAKCEGGAQLTPALGQTYVLLFKNADASSRCVFMPVQSCVQTPGEIHLRDAAAEALPPSTDSSPFLHTQSDLPDHQYARPSSQMLPEGVGVSTRRSRKRQGSRWMKTSDKPTEGLDWSHACSLCRMLFPNAERLSDHHRKSHPVCSVCGTLFTGVLKLRQHEISEHGLLPFTCNYCPKRFNHKAHRDLHVKTRHTGEKTCQCDICGKGYACISVMKTHRLTHFDKAFICSICGKSFYHACHLTRHKMVHQDERPHRCPTCGRGFTQAANLRSHQVIHSGERELCSICGKRYRCLRNHLISKHSDELPLTQTVISCNVCGKKFPTPHSSKFTRGATPARGPLAATSVGRATV
ncbi:zinc finger protein 665-like isoform X2 [Sphaeramia orbicularis]|uniref:zinc finger protein 665-like isoform X2 n=1 Tax=Sphaeramia orbicularis TaxID=375764 RepID=UPI0011811382|nr:zinc finger protein 665-like isoform X2 [Sphaeramia orbicularis]